MPSTIDAVPSVEASSTTMHSSATDASASTDPRARSIPARAFQQGMITDTTGSRAKSRLHAVC
jgi:hypothetical protein